MNPMADIEKVIKAWERCKICDMSLIASEEGKKAYIDCEYTNVLYCRQDILIHETIKLLKEQKQIVRCKDCKNWQEKLGYCDNTELYIADGEWFCADGERWSSENDERDH